MTGDSVIETTIMFFCSILVSDLLSLNVTSHQVESMITLKCHVIQSKDCTTPEVITLPGISHVVVVTSVKQD